MSIAATRTSTGSWPPSVPTSPGSDHRAVSVYARHSMPDPSTLFESARNGDRVALARLLSLVERGGDESRAVAGLAYNSPGEAYTVGITGAPGAGKSTLTDHLIAIGRKRGLGTAGHGAAGGDSAGADGAVGGGP